MFITKPGNFNCSFIRVSVIMVIWLSNISILSIPADEGYSRNLLCPLSLFRNVSCILKWISTFLFLTFPSSNLAFGKTSSLRKSF